MSRRQDAEVLDPQVMDDVEFLQKARDRLRKNGWTTRSYRNHAGAVCLIGSAIYGNGSRLDTHRGDEIAQRFAHLVGFPTRAHVESFNDRVCSGGEEALSVIDRAIERRLRA